MAPQPAAATLTPAVPADRYYPSIQGLRGFSALSVLCCHIYRMSSHGGIFPATSPLTEAVLASLGQGVDLFFIISGFVIPASLVRHGDLGRFFIDRLLRIMPLFVAIHLLVFTVGPFMGYKWLRDIGVGYYLELFFSNLSFTALPLGLPLAQQNSWTLTYEWGFYIAVAAAWVLGGRGQARRPVAAVIAIATVAVCSVFSLCLFFAAGIGFARFRPSWRMPVAVELVAMPIALVAFYYCGQFVGDAAALPLAAVIFLAALTDGSLTSRLLCSRVMQFLGLISYSLYLVHPIAIFPLELVAERLVHHGLPLAPVFAGLVLASLAVALAGSVLSYHLLEVRLRRLLAGWIKGERQPRRHAIA